ncbi:3-hydroxyacyl-CoA dehydrogenase NAD-binding domain-containing protein [Sinorhizobium sp. BG8]|uniref:3-hydroxyacyl-CoA dehydrogenase NAD-binding domain-containing protein n=1 Tax=Sinorhizobium sp. BG8 TaxID=2613773 RepID=UPI00193CF7C5|nr:3-hydroxyacyl-CoA dehydrogenase NAD-binding domain-containing protein [Sinorhizobium sp. BG8]QRM57039.1 3-hydroxyacyl-CoA dehydrogenase [Sinorhizobium sp. BG8]QRM57906.1 3-hydroxyacyl-CoA dehydrogenase [Sinorhizobium sp. BG8]
MRGNEEKSGEAVGAVAILGAGLIGCSWAALFAATGRPIHLYDSHVDAGAKFAEFWNAVRDTLAEMGLPHTPVMPEYRVFGSPADAVTDVDFVQECIPERLELKRVLYKEIEPALRPTAVVATSSSGLKLSDLQDGWQNPRNLIIAHPFNPPHIIPLVELYGNEATMPEALGVARGLYESCGKKTITLKREVMGHVANRLQAALWREAIHLVAEDVASVRDVDIAISAGPGMRWAVMGPHMLLNLGGGQEGIRAYCEQFRDSYALWWDDLGKPNLDHDTVSKLIDGLEEEIGGRDYNALRRERDTKLIALLGAIKQVETENNEPAVVG